MYAPETKIFIALLTGLIVEIILMTFFIIAIIRNHRERSVLHKRKIKDEFEVLDKEKARIAKDLHDDLGSALALIKHRLEMFPSKESRNVQYIVELEDLLADAMKRLRATSYALLPPILERSGIESALKFLVEEMTATTDLKINFACSVDVIPSEIELHIYRIVQEALTNIIKHSQASTATITLVRIDNNIELNIRDNGIGFENRLISSYRGSGLRNILSRSDILHAKLYLNSAPGKGVEFLIEIPAYGKDQNHNSR